jgi:gentisate 1,2-dioxygenase
MNEPETTTAAPAAVQRAEGGAMADAEARRQIKADLARMNCRVHQPDDPPLFTREPRSEMETLHWRWADLVPLLERIGAQMAIGSGGVRRTLRLANPGIPYGTTPTFWASIQVILPGEVAEAHRHSANAFRFILKGRGCTTTVDGERYEMNEGDLVLTPAWTWHDHEHHGTEPMIWLDVLDINVMRSLQATFFEPYAGEKQPVRAIADESARAFGSGIMRPPRNGPAPRGNPLLTYSRERALAALEQASGLAPDPFDDVILEYQNPVDGGAAMPTLAMTLQKIRPGFKGNAQRRTGSRVIVVVSGHGTSIIDGKRFAWGPGDFIAVKPWAWVEHHGTSNDDAVLFQVNDSPTLDALGYYRAEALQTGDGHQESEAAS